MLRQVVWCAIGKKGHRVLAGRATCEFAKITNEVCLVDVAAINGDARQIAPHPCDLRRGLPEAQDTSQHFRHYACLFDEEPAQLLRANTAMADMSVDIDR